MQTATFPGRYENLQKIGEWVEKAAIEAGLDDSAVYAVQLAVDEAATNIIEHAYGAEGVGDIHCTAEITDHGLTVTLRDNGRPFQPEEVPAPNLNRPIEEIEPHGLGLFLMRKMMDEVDFEFTAQGNVLKMTKRRGSR